MGNVLEVQLIDGAWACPFEFTITTAGAVVANSDGTTTTNPYVSVVRASAGTYTATIVGNFQKVISRLVNFVAAAASSQQAQITAIGLGTGTPTATGESTTTVTIITGNSNAVPAAADQASGTVAVRIVFQKNKI